MNQLAKDWFTSIRSAEKLAHTELEAEDGTCCLMGHLAKVMVDHGLAKAGSEFRPLYELYIGEAGPYSGYELIDRNAKLLGLSLQQMRKLQDRAYDINDSAGEGWSVQERADALEKVYLELIGG